MYNKILVALDLADIDGAKKVTEKSNLLAKAMNAEVHTISIVPDYGTSMVGAFFNDDHQKDAMSKLGDEIQAFVAENFDPEVSVRPHIVSGSVYDEIMRASDKLGCDLIVIGAHRPELSDYLLGPNSARVVRHSKVSVLVVRH